MPWFHLCMFIHDAFGLSHEPYVTMCMQIEKCYLEDADRDLLPCGGALTALPTHHHCLAEACGHAIRRVPGEFS